MTKEWQEASSCSLQPLLLAVAQDGNPEITSSDADSDAEPFSATGSCQHPNLKRADGGTMCPLTCQAVRCFCNSQQAFAQPPSGQQRPWRRKTRTATSQKTPSGPPQIFRQKMQRCTTVPDGFATSPLDLLHQHYPLQKRCLDHQTNANASSSHTISNMSLCLSRLAPRLESGNASVP